MRNNGTLLIVLISIILLVYLGIEGLQIGNFQILSISQIKQENEELNNRIEEASTLTTINYPDNIKTLEETYERYKIQKQKYEDLSGVTNKNDSNIYEMKQYDIGYLWRLIGNYATKRNLNLGIQVQKNNSGNNTYNINFDIKGKYTNISQFITDIENDSDLYFRIYDFKISGSGEIINSTFTVRNVNLDATTISKAQTVK